MSTIVYDHTVDPPEVVALPCVVRGVGVPSGCPRARLAELGLYPPGGMDEPPPGFVATGWTREIRDGLSVAVPTALEAVGALEEQRQAGKSAAQKRAENRVLDVYAQLELPANPTQEQLEEKLEGLYAENGQAALKTAVVLIGRLVALLSRAQGNALTDLPAEPHEEDVP